MRICLTLFLLALSISLATGCRLDRGRRDTLATHPGGAWNARLTRIWQGDSSSQATRPMPEAFVEPSLPTPAADPVVTSTRPVDQVRSQEVIQRPVFEPLGDEGVADRVAVVTGGATNGSDGVPEASVLAGEPGGNERDFSTGDESFRSGSLAPTADEIAGLNTIAFNRLQVDYEKLRRRGWVLNQFVLGVPGENHMDVAQATGELELVDAELIDTESVNAESGSLDGEVSELVQSDFESESSSESAEAESNEPRFGETPEPQPLSSQLAVRADQEVTPAGQQETVVLHAKTEQRPNDPQQADAYGGQGKSVLATFPSDVQSSSAATSPSAVNSSSAAEANETQPVRDQTQPVRLTAQQVNYRDDKQLRLAPKATHSAPLATAALKPSPANDEQRTALDSEGNYYLPPQPILRLQAQTPLGKPLAQDSEARFLFRDTRIVRGQHLLDGPRRAVPTGQEPTRMVNQPRKLLQASQPTSPPAEANGDVRR